MARERPEGCAFYASPFGVLEIRTAQGAVRSILPRGEAACAAAENALTRQVCRELEEYFRGQRTAFTFPCAPEGTAFQKRVWKALLSISYGQTCSYRDLAQSIGQPGAARAVGAACGKNPVLIAIPCHRVIAAGGAPGGYRGGAEMKRALLNLEAGK